VSLTDVAGIELGHWTDGTARTGCTVVVLPSPNITAIDIRGAAPGSRETALLGHGMKVLEANAIVLSGGSAYGLASADGVMAELEAMGRGHDTPFGVVPIVPTAVIYDLGVGDPSVRPTAEAGALAFRAATSGPVEIGQVGVGCGATTGKWRGFEHAVPSGVFSASASLEDATVAALVVVNAIGDVDPNFDAAPLAFPDKTDLTNTTLAVIATDASVDRSDLARLCIRAHDAFAASIYPVHTRYDGDAVFAVSCGDKQVDLDQLGEVVFSVTRSAILAARPS
jgi:L-aminopeptidase/D-esterase-like protein